MCIIFYEVWFLFYIKVNVDQVTFLLLKELPTALTIDQYLVMIKQTGPSDSEPFKIFYLFYLKQSFLGVKF